MNKRQLIDAIRAHNPTASERFLKQFEEEELARYLDNLEGAAERRRLIHVRTPADVPARKAS